MKIQIVQVPKWKRRQYGLKKGMELDAEKDHLGMGGHGAVWITSPKTGERIQLKSHEWKALFSTVAHTPTKKSITTEELVKLDRSWVKRFEYDGNENLRQTGTPRMEARRRAAEATIGQTYPDYAYNSGQVTRARLEALAVGFFVGLGTAAGIWSFL